MTIERIRHFLGIGYGLKISILNISLESEIQRKKWRKYRRNSIDICLCATDFWLISGATLRSFSDYPVCSHVVSAA